jgi:hypothetical protein
MGEAVPVPLIDPGVEVTVYPVMVLPPLETGGVKVTVACVFPAVAVPIVGASGAVGGAVVEEKVEGEFWLLYSVEIQSAERVRCCRRELRRVFQLNHNYRNHYLLQAHVRWSTARPVDGAKL